MEKSYGPRMSFPIRNSPSGKSFETNTFITNDKSPILISVRLLPSSDKGSPFAVTTLNNIVSFSILLAKEVSIKEIPAPGSTNPQTDLLFTITLQKIC